MKLRISRQAWHDLLDVRAYTLAAYGLEQLAAYEALIEAALERIASDPSSGRERPELRAGVRARHIGQPGHGARGESAAQSGCPVVGVAHGQQTLGWSVDACERRRAPLAFTPTSRTQRRARPIDARAAPGSRATKVAFARRRPPITAGRTQSCSALIPDHARANPLLVVGDVRGRTTKPIRPLPCPACANDQSQAFSCVSRVDARPKSTEASRVAGVRATKPRLASDDALAPARDPGRPRRRGAAAASKPNRGRR